MFAAISTVGTVLMLVGCALLAAFCNPLARRLAASYGVGESMFRRWRETLLVVGIVGTLVSVLWLARFYDVAVAISGLTVVAMMVRNWIRPPRES
jgi:hypothetical protein